MISARQLAFLALRDIDRRDSYVDLAVDRVLQKYDLAPADRRLLTELVYGVVRRQRTLDYLLTCLGDRPAGKQPPDLRRILQLGLYQLVYLDQIPVSAAVNTSVDLAKANGLKGLSKVVNGILRRYQRERDGGKDWLDSPQISLGEKYSLPDWLLELFLGQWGRGETETLCQCFNHNPALDLRINPLKTNRAEVAQALEAIGLTTENIAGLSQGLRVTGKTGAITQLPGFAEGWWTVQDASAQWVAQILDPQRGETIFDVCAAPGGKTTHMAELMQDQGQIYAGDRHGWRLQKLAVTQQRLGLTSIKSWEGDMTKPGTKPPIQWVDRALLDVPCSGLGTLHRNPDLRWRQTPATIATLLPLQQALLTAIAPMVKPGGILVYSTCTLNRAENEAQIEQFLASHPEWRSAPFQWINPQEEVREIIDQGMLTILPHQHHQDGFFIANLKKA
ncbi:MULTISPECIES: 16S rRNA (cytosine(967)-C(5))-methyltransferase [unclassified Synechocystis]|uniref:16S rRNA (cytosine(967)-C(5))-methyltransferase n=1 Tax=unclassified Synechocystis TaxID=2640012 RepID=UPI000427CC07|nr:MULTISPECIES: 16S rRNA (cytosine(967)-C(5))-methyltransferase [unclassified Synechocystis]AIE73696.1 Ribosomal RNA small subunit methyltransferase B [Synechocystis sp. PCC 6714]MCT0252257.1 16S rRNA (cytosine(967)-C(5))-methyltransferase [Synechocystis sp. CS-94]